MLTLAEDRDLVKLPVSIYDVKISSADGKTKDLLSEKAGKVTLIFNVAAGCGNIPQHGVLEELNQIYADEPDFSIVAVVVDDFVCHGYPEFQNGLDEYVRRNGLSLTAGEMAQKYAVDNFGTTYQFTELTNGRYDKHTYDPNYLPNENKTQDIHPLWYYLTGCHDADFMPNGAPYTSERVPWSDRDVPTEDDKRTQQPLTGNFTKFLISRDGTRIVRYQNGFLLGERDIFGKCFPWIKEKYKPDGRRNHLPGSDHDENDDFLRHYDPEKGPWPNKRQRLGVELSLEMISQDINYFLSLGN